MNAFLLLIPFLLIRFTLLSILNKQAIRRAAHFPSMQGKQVFAYVVYQISTIAIFVYLCFLNVAFEYSLRWMIGLILYVSGLLLCGISIVHFANPSSIGLNVSGIYRFSRNPMYIAYFIFFIGCAMLTHSYLLAAIVIVFQVSAHWIILAEERWCIDKFGQEYRVYMKKVGRYFSLGAR